MTVSRQLKRRQQADPDFLNFASIRGWQEQNEKPPPGCEPKVIEQVIAFAGVARRSAVKWTTLVPLDDCVVVQMTNRERSALSDSSQRITK